jgi:hypothetical protein
MPRFTYLFTQGYTRACDPARTDAGPGERTLKTLFLALALVGAVVRPALAEQCTVLEYQEMKDMTVNDLVKEACKTNKVTYDNFDRSISLPTLSPAWREADRDFDQCKGQVDRMMRILQAKGVSEKLGTLCEQQAQGKTISAPADAKAGS